MSNDCKLYLSIIDEVSGNVERTELDKKTILETVGVFITRTPRKGEDKKVVAGTPFKYGVVAEYL